MYFDFEDYHPDITPVGRAISWREGILISIIVHLVMIIFVLLFPRLFPYDRAAAPRAPGPKTARTSGAVRLGPHGAIAPESAKARQSVAVQPGQQSGARG